MMTVDCPRCGRTLEYTTERPSFCSHCGQDLVRPHGETTVPVPFQAITLPPPGQPVPGPTPDPESIGGYRLLRRLGGGGMGTVYEAEDATGRKVALKLIAADLARSRESVDRFRQEGRLASMIAHPRCVFVFAAEEEAGRPYIVMELVPGSTLRELVEHVGPLRPRLAVKKIMDVIEGLREAHGRGVIHRDVKPSNCFLDAEGRVKIGDFGLAKALVTKVDLTRPGTFLGTVLYSSPEQVRGERLDVQTDVYSVAATLYFLLTGQAPFQINDLAAAAARIAADPAPAMRGLRPDIPAALDRVVLKGLERNRDRRWRNLEDFRQALLPFLPGQLSFSGLGLRFGAFLIDYAVMNVIGAVVNLIADPLGLRASLTGVEALSDPRSAVFSVAVWLFYFGLPEGLWGWSLGKRLLRLRVWTADGGDPPGLAPGLFRTAVCWAALSPGLWVIILTRPQPYRPEEIRPEKVLSQTAWNLLVPFTPFLGMVIGTGILCLPMRSRNGYRGYHDVVSGTRVVRLPESRRSWTVSTRDLARGLSPTRDTPGRIASFKVRGILYEGDRETTALGEDVLLARQVILWLRPLSAAPAGPARRELSRRTRLRWLVGATLSDRQCDALQAPIGCPLSDQVAAQGRFSWTDARPFLADLTAELRQAAAEGTLPVALGTDHVWIQSDGHPVLLDAPVHASGRTPTATDEDAAERARTLLRRVIPLALEGREAADAMQGPEVRAPLAGHAFRVLRRLYGAEAASKSLERFERELRRNKEKPAEVTRPRRAGHLAILAAFSLLGLGCCMFPATWLPTIVLSAGVSDRRYDEQLVRNLDVLVADDSAILITRPDPLGRVSVLPQLIEDMRLRKQMADMVQQKAQEQERLTRSSRLLESFVEQGQRQAAAFPVTRPRLDATRFIAAWRVNEETRSGRPNPVPLYVMILSWPALWIVWAFLTRGGLSFRMAGIQLLRRDGRKASRLQCAGRAVLIWLPVAALLLLALLLELRFAYPTGDRIPSAWLSYASSAASWAAGILLASYAGFALWRPTRSLHDWIMGTYLVPR